MGAKYIQSDYNDASSAIQSVSNISSVLAEAKSKISTYNSNMKVRCEGPVVKLFSSRLDTYLNIITTMTNKIEELANASNSCNNKVASAISPEPEISQDKIDEITQEITNLNNDLSSLKSSLYTTNKETGETIVNPNVASQIKTKEDELDTAEKKKKELSEKLEEVASIDAASGNTISSQVAAISRIKISL